VCQPSARRPVTCRVRLTFAGARSVRVWGKTYAAVKVYRKR
jgi:hypothetical protein